MFGNAEIGDSVASKRFGLGVIEETIPSTKYLILVRFKDLDHMMFSSERYSSQRGKNTTKLENEMFKVGDRVVSDAFGEGVVVTLEGSSTYPVQVRFDLDACDKDRTYTQEGEFMRGIPGVYDTRNIKQKNNTVENANLKKLLAQYMQILDMCAGTEVEPKYCVRFQGNGLQHLPNFEGAVADYSFALALVENKPVFVGDELYIKSEKLSTVVVTGVFGKATLQGSKNGVICGVGVKNLTWEAPLRTFNLNGDELVLPKVREEGFLLRKQRLQLDLFVWDTRRDRDAVEAALFKVLSGE